MLFSEIRKLTGNVGKGTRRTQEREDTGYVLGHDDIIVILERKSWRCGVLYT